MHSVVCSVAGGSMVDPSTATPQRQSLQRAVEGQAGGTLRPRTGIKRPQQEGGSAAAPLPGGSPSIKVRTDGAGCNFAG
jgi:hypothetical protein